MIKEISIKKDDSIIDYYPLNEDIVIEVLKEIIQDSSYDSLRLIKNLINEFGYSTI